MRKCGSTAKKAAKRRLENRTKQSRTNRATQAEKTGTVRPKQQSEEKIRILPETKTTQYGTLRQKIRGADRCGQYLTTPENQRHPRRNSQLRNTDDQADLRRLHRSEIRGMKKHSAGKLDHPDSAVCLHHRQERNGFGADNRRNGHPAQGVGQRLLHRIE